MNTWGNDQLKKLLEVNLQVTNRISCCDLFVLILWAGIDFLALVSARYNMSYLAKMLGGKKAKPKAKKKSKKKDKKHSKKRKSLAEKYGSSDTAGSKAKSKHTIRPSKARSDDAVTITTPSGAGNSAAFRIDSDDDDEVGTATSCVRANSRLDSDSDSDTAADPPRPPQEAGSRLDSGSDSDADPPRPSAQGDDEDSDAEPPRRVPGELKMKNGAKAGLLKVEDYEREEERIKLLNVQKNSGASMGGNAGTVYRTKTGHRMNAEEALKAKVKEDKESQLLRKRERAEMSKGVVQRKMERERAERARKIAKTSFARYRDDKDLETTLKHRHRVEDPMAQYIADTTKKTATDEGTKDVEMGKDMPYPVYKGASRPPNRFKIPPGHRWDGVQRGNGFEKKLLASIPRKGGTSFSRRR